MYVAEEWFSDLKYRYIVLYLFVTVTQIIASKVHCKCRHLVPLPFHMEPTAGFHPVFLKW